MISIGTHPKTGLTVYVVRSPFGPYIQCGDATDDNPTPIGCWLPKNVATSDVTLETAVALLKFPRVLGPHPITGVDVCIQLHHSGACLRSETIIHGTQRHTVTRIEPSDNVLTLTLERALELLDQVGKR